MAGIQIMVEKQFGKGYHSSCNSGAKPVNLTGFFHFFNTETLVDPHSRT